MQNTPKGMRLHIGIFGRRNAGKSSLLNALTGQEVAIVSPQPGTTTDPVEKPMEFLPIGPVVWIDTAGLDDTGELGEARTEKSRKVIERTELALLVSEAGQWTPFEEELLATLTERGIPTAVIANKIDLSPGKPLDTGHNDIPVVEASAVTGQGILDIKQAIIRLLPASWTDSQRIAGDLVRAGGMAVLVVPIDMEAPRGRLILPQVQTIRDLLDHDAACAMVKEHELRGLLDNLRRPPELVITDSQAFLKVAADTPRKVPLTSFSILFSRLKGDLDSFVEGAMAIDKLTSGDRVLVAEACTHHPVGEDIGRVKIPRWLKQYTGAELDFETVAGQDFPEDLSSYSLVVHCGSCTFNKQGLLGRILRCREAGVPITNYGMAIAHSQGILERALGPFPSALERYRELNS